MVFCVGCPGQNINMNGDLNMIKVNAGRWCRDIEWSIEEWEDFRNSDLCETAGDRQKADEVLERLENILYRLMHAGYVSEEDFAWYITLL